MDHYHGRKTYLPTLLIAFLLSVTIVHADVIFTPTGSSQVEIDSKGLAIWIVQGNVTNISDVVCGFSDERDESEITNVTYDVAYSAPADSPGKFEVYWDVDGDKFAEGSQLGVYCDVTVDGNEYKNIEQVVYINRQKTIMGYIEYFYNSVMEILGYQRYEMQIVTPQFWDGRDSKLLVEFKDKRGPYADATCSAIIEEEQSNVTHTLQMSYYGAGLYNVTWTPTGGVTEALAKVSCEVPALNSTFQDSLMLSAHKQEMKISVSGTDYYVGERGTVFVQLVDDQGLAVNSNTQCSVSINYPYSYDPAHAPWVENAPMTYKNGSGGLYYYDFIVPNFQGVYMVSVLCNYEAANTFMYSMSGTETFAPTRTTTLGTYSGNAVFLNDYEDWIYERCIGAVSGGQKICDAYYDFNASVHFDTAFYNVTGFEMNYMGEASHLYVGEFYYWNWSSSEWVALGNLTFSGASSGGVPIGVGDFFQKKFDAVYGQSISGTPGSGSNIVRLRVRVSGGVVFDLFSNWLNIELYPKRGNIVAAQGSSELNVKTGVPIITDASPKLQMVQGTGREGVQGNILVQVTQASVSVTNTNCQLTMYYPRNATKLLNNVSMTYFGDDGMYNYSFTPPMTGQNELYPMRVLCSGNLTGSSTIQAASAFQVSGGGYQMQVLG